MSIYEEIALEAFKAREECEGQEGGGITPLIDKASVTTIVIKPSGIYIHISYCYQELCGLSDCLYHVDTSMHECVYRFGHGELTCDDKAIFSTPWVDSSWRIQEAFFTKYAEYMPVTAAKFFEKKRKHDENKIADSLCENMELILENKQEYALPFA